MSGRRPLDLPTDAYYSPLPSSDERSRTKDGIDALASPIEDIRMNDM